MLPIDHIYIINLDHRTDRWDTIQKTSMHTIYLARKETPGG